MRHFTLEPSTLNMVWEDKVRGRWRLWLFAVSLASSLSRKHQNPPWRHMVYQTMVFAFKPGKGDTKDLFSPKRPICSCGLWRKFTIKSLVGEVRCRVRREKLSTPFVVSCYDNLHAECWRTCEFMVNMFGTFALCVEVNGDIRNMCVWMMNGCSGFLENFTVLSCRQRANMRLYLFISKYVL